MAFIPHIKSIQAFEATARHLNYIGAAKELFVTPAAVGQQVRLLEAWLGVKLFRRHGHGQNRLALTQEAARGLSDFQLGFRSIEAGLAKLKSIDTENVLTITASQVVVSKWLLPLLEDFTTKHPHIDIRLDVSEKIVDLGSGQADIGIRCGAGIWPNLVSKKLFDEEMVAVCGPKIADEFAQPKQLLDHTILHDSNELSAKVFPGWSNWFAVQGIKLEPDHKSFRINAPLALIEAAASGQGIALVRYRLVKTDIETGRLRHLCQSIRYPIDWGYYLVASPRAVEKESVIAFKDWLKNIVGT
jgi:LysR family transcriptional regulator, glycine cleavage system transcriptional activator